MNYPFSPQSEFCFVSIGIANQTWENSFTKTMSGFVFLGFDCRVKILITQDLSPVGRRRSILGKE